jgi:hypothetical protein
VAVAVAVRVGVSVAVAVADGVGVGGRLELGLVVKSELKPPFSVLALRALTAPTNFNRYFELVASALDGVKVALLPPQVMLPARI